MIILRWSCWWSIFRFSCQWSIESWSNRRIDLNRIIDLTIKLIRLSGLDQLSGLTWLSGLIRLSVLIRLIYWSGRVIWIFSRVPELFLNSKTFIVSNSDFLVPRWLVSSDLRRSCTVGRTYPAGAKFSGRRFGVISFLLQLRRNCALRRNFSSGT